ncbi:uncharacterized protein [Anabrus simplex]|uniref:uncharacterized protein n=1 Tax=Anabrus simplex TaxID=316456 RepID=UPI0035A29DBE
MILKLSTWKMIQADPGSTMKKDLSYVASSQSGVKWPQYLTGLFAAGGALCSGAIMGWPLMQYDSDFTSYRVPEAGSANESAVLVMSMLTLGAIHGAFPASFLADIVGRKVLLLLVAGLFWISGVLLIIASRAAWLVYMSHFLAGFATGCASVIIPLYNEEIAETNVRGRIGVMYGMNFCGGVLLSCLMQVIFPNFNVPVLHFLLPVLFFMTFLWMPESPVFLVARGKHKKAQQSLQWLRTSKSHPLYDIGAEIHTIETFLENTRFKKMSKYYVEESGNMLCCGTRKGSNILIVCILMLFRPICGAFALISYRETFFEPAGLSIGATSTIVSASMFLSTLVTLYLVDRFGR